MAKLRLSVLNTIRKMNKPIELRFILTCRFKLDVPTKEPEETFAGFNGGKPILITEPDNIMTIIDRIFRIILEKIPTFETEGTGWRCGNVEYFDMQVVEADPISGSS